MSDEHHLAFEFRGDTHSPSGGAGGGDSLDTKDTGDVHQVDIFNEKWI